jgi:hypothetical protein
MSLRRILLSFNRGFSFTRGDFKSLGQPFSSQVVFSFFISPRSDQPLLERLLRALRAFLAHPRAEKARLAGPGGWQVKIAELESKINAGALQLLKGPWVLTCDQCGTSSNAELTANGIEQLLTSGQVKAECANPECQRHTFQVSLHDLIKLRITG